MLYLIRENESETTWSVNNFPRIKSEEIWEIQADGRELEFIKKVMGYKQETSSVQSWFGEEAREIAVKIGAAR